MSGPDTRLDPARHARIFANEVLPESDYPLATRQALPKAIILGGQPGAGKGGLARIAKTELADDVVVIDPDALREFHPDIKTFRQAHPYTWSGDTHPDASAWADELLEATIEGRKNLIFDTTLSNGPWSAELINKLQAKGFDVDVRVVAAHKLQSELALTHALLKSWMNSVTAAMFDSPFQLRRSVAVRQPSQPTSTGSGIAAGTRCDTQDSMQRAVVLYTPSGKNSDLNLTLPSKP